VGPALSKKGKIISALGAQSATGNSSIALLLGRYLLHPKAATCAFIDPGSAPPSFFPFAPPHSPALRSFRQLLPYADQLNVKTIEHFFGASPEGLRYIPHAESPQPKPDENETIRLLRTLQPFFDYLIVDWKSSSNEIPLALLEMSDLSLLTSSLENSSVIALQKMEKSLLSHHFPLQASKVLFVQTTHNQPLLTDFSNWTSSLSFLGTLPFQGENFKTVLGGQYPPDFTNSQGVSSLLKAIGAFLEKGGSIPLSPAPSSHPTERVHLLHQKLLETLRTGGHLDASSGNGVLKRDLLEPKAREILERLIQEFKIPSREQIQNLMAETLDLCFGLGPLEPLLQDNEITEIMVNGPDHIFIEKEGRLEKTGVRFMNDQQLLTIIERILAPIGRRIDESQPYVDGRLPDGSRINAVIPPLSLDGPLLTIRKFSKKKLEASDLIRYGSLTQEASDFLSASVRARKNIVVSGGTGSGKTTLLNVLSTFIPDHERIVTIEDSAELQLSQVHVVRLEGRPANLEGKGQVTIRDLVINALRMRPDRIIVGEVRGSEALDMLQAMNTGHDGSLTTGHANSPRDMLARLETMCLFTGLNLPIRAIREQIARAVHLVIQQSRLPNGKRSVTRISEIQGMEGDVILLQDLFVKEDGEGLVRKSFAPKFIPDLEAVGYQWPGHAAKKKITSSESVGL
jgi:pilus assembly protein CpaF